jgi:hypothetical protein
LGSACVTWDIAGTNLELEAGGIHAGNRALTHISNINIAFRLEMIQEFKMRVHQVLEEDIPGDRLGDAVNLMLVFLIILNSLAVILETVPGIYDSHKLLFSSFAGASIAIFTLEYYSESVGGRPGAEVQPTYLWKG